MMAKRDRRSNVADNSSTDDAEPVDDGVVDEARATRANEPGEFHYSLLHRILARVPVLLSIYRVAVAFVGFSIVGLGVLLLPLPGPGWVVIFLGVTVLASEFPAAERVLVVLRKWAVVVLRILARMRRIRARLRRHERDVAAAAEAAAVEKADEHPAHRRG